MAHQTIKENAEYIATWDDELDVLHVSTQAGEAIETLDLTTPEARAKGNFLAEAIAEALKRGSGVTQAKAGSDGADGAENAAQG